jgi:hypothetical protein
LVAVDDGLEEEAGRVAVVLLDEAPIGKHRCQVVAQDAAEERHKRRRRGSRLKVNKLCVLGQRVRVRAAQDGALNREPRSTTEQSAHLATQSSESRQRQEWLSS